MIEVIGTGSNSSEVVRAKRISDGVDVAVKLLKNVFGSDYAARQLFSEIHILRKLSQSRGSPFVAQLLDVIVPEEFETTPGCTPYLFIVMEYVPYDLVKMMQSLDGESSDQFTEKHVLFLLYNSLCCLNFIHSAGLMHRDIKTNNILVNSSCVTKLCDFGLARPCLGQNAHSKNRPPGKTDGTSSTDRSCDEEAESGSGRYGGT